VRSDSENPKSEAVYVVLPRLALMEIDALLWNQTRPPNQRFEPTAASVPQAVPSSLRSSAAAQARR
jgi:hypothetical protein